jgi:hypothetical protein
MKMKLLNVPTDLPPGTYDAQIVEVTEDEITFEMCDPKMAEHAKYWREAVPVIRDVVQELESEERSNYIPRGTVQSWINRLNGICP